MKVHLLAVLIGGGSHNRTYRVLGVLFWVMNILYVDIYFTIALKYSNHNEGF